MTFIRKTEPGSYSHIAHSPSIVTIRKDLFFQFDAYEIGKIIELDNASEELKSEINKGNTLNLIDGREKVFFSKKSGPYNYVYIGFSQILQALNDYKNPKIYIDEGQLADASTRETFDNFFYRFLNDLGVEYENFQPRNYDFILADKVIFPTWSDPSMENANNLYDVFKKYFNYNENPTKKAYISRKTYHNRYYGNIIGIPYTEDVRMYDDEILEDYLSKKGFDIVTPEADFKTFEEQMNYFAQVKTVMAPSCSGLSNSFYMKPGSNIFEIYTSFIVRHGPLGIDENGLDRRDEPAYGLESLHQIYHAISYIKDHNYFAIPNHTRKAQDIIDRIEKNPAFRKLIDE